MGWGGSCTPTRSGAGPGRAKGTLPNHPRVLAANLFRAERRGSRLRSRLFRLASQAPDLAAELGVDVAHELGEWRASSTVKVR